MIKSLSALTLGMVALSLPAAAIAQTAAPKPCVTVAEAKGLVSFALPDLIQTVSKSCAPSLGGNAYLTRNSADIISRYRAVGEANWPIAKAAIIKIAGEDGKMMSALPDEATKALIGAGISSELSKAVKPGSCQMISETMEQLAPLPAANVGNLVGIILGAVANSKKNGTNSKLNICPTTALATTSFDAK